MTTRTAKRQPPASREQAYKSLAGALRLLRRPSGDPAADKRVVRAAMVHAAEYIRAQGGGEGS